MPRFIRAACLLLALACSSTAAFAADFIIDPAQSFLTLTGELTLNSPHIPFTEQAPGTLTTYFSGSLMVDNLNPNGAIGLTGNAIKATSHPGTFLPFGSPANSAWQLTDFFGPGTQANLAVREQYLSISAGYTPVPGGLSGIASLYLNSDQFDIDAGAVGTWTQELALPAHDENHLVNLEVIGNELQLTIPINIAASTQPYLAVQYTGQIVARVPLSERPSPEVEYGGFEGTLVLPGQTKSTGLNTGRLNPATSDALQPTEGLHVGTLDVTNGTSTLTQYVMNARRLNPDDMFEISFDIGNFEMPNGDTPGDDVDELISVQAYFARSNALQTPIGEAFTLAQLSAIDEGTWWLDQKLLFDASLLGPDEFSYGLQFVIQATSTSGATGRLVVDDIQLRRVPEPATWILGALGAFAIACARARRSTRRSAIRRAPFCSADRPSAARK